MDSEIPHAVVPFEKWVDGDLLPFLENFHFNVLQVMAAGKPVIKKFMLLLHERVLFYAKEHPGIIKTMGLSCAAMDEEDIEMFNALLGRFKSARDTSPNIDTYIYISGLISGMHDLSKQLDSLALSGKGRGTGRGEARATEATEHMRLRQIYSTPSWEKTNEVVDDWILDLFQKALDGDADLENSWPEEDRIQRGYEHLDRARTSLRSWLKMHERPPAYYDDPRRWCLRCRIVLGA